MSNGNGHKIPLISNKATCSFCGAPEGEVAVMLGGKGDARICNVCAKSADKLMTEKIEEIKRQHAIPKVKL